MKLILDVDSPVERVRLPIFAPLFPMKHAFCLTRSIFSLFSLPLPSPSFVLTTGQRNVSLPFCLLASISLRIPWDSPVQRARGQIPPVGLAFCLLTSNPHALDQQIQALPAFPQALPSRLPIALAPQKSSPTGDLAHHLFHRPPLRLFCRLPADHQQFFPAEPRMGWLLRVPFEQVAQLQQPERYRCEHSQYPLDILLLPQMPFFDPTAGLETMMILFHHPAHGVPLHPLPRFLLTAHRN